MKLLNYFANFQISKFPNLHISFLLSVILSNFCFAQSQPFEGIIKSEFYSAENNSYIHLTWFITSKQIALEMQFGDDSVAPPQTTRFIMRADKDVMIVLSIMPDGKKFFSTVEEKNIHAGEDFNYKSFETVKTDEFNIINEHKCRKLFSKTNSIKSTCWVTEDLQINIIDYSKFMKSDYDILAMSNWNINGFPMKSVTTKLNGDLISTMFVKEISLQKINNIEFEIPKGAKEWKPEKKDK